jgi:isoleucyl-tRNA synthetase
MAPITPFIAESIWQAVGEKSSVHLAEWPAVMKVSDNTIVDTMALTRTAVSRALEARDKVKIKVRQPLASLTLPTTYSALTPALLAIIAEEVNVKIVGVGGVEEATLDTVLTPELTREGDVRELIRAVQALRKKAGLQLSDKAKLVVSENAKEIIGFATDELTRAGISEVTFGEGVESAVLSFGAITLSLA